MSKPPIIPDQAPSGIALDPRTFERIIPESRRPDGSVRKELKIRPGFTPQEDVRRFRGTRQAQMDVNALPKGHIIGWAPPPSSTAPKDMKEKDKPLSKAAKKNEKRREKKREKKEPDTQVKDNWEDDDGDEAANSASPSTTVIGDPLSAGAQASITTQPKDQRKGSSEGPHALADQLQKLDVR